MIKNTAVWLARLPYNFTRRMLSRNKTHVKQELEYFKSRNIRVMVLDIQTTLIDPPEVIAAAKVQWKHLRQPMAEYPDNWHEVYSKWVRGDVTAVVAMQLLSIKKSTFNKLDRNYRL